MGIWKKILEGGTIDKGSLRHPSEPIKENPFKHCMCPPTKPIEWVSDNKSKEEPEETEIIVQQENE